MECCARVIEAVQNRRKNILMTPTLKTPTSKLPVKNAKRPQFLNRYTTLPILLDILVNKHITLLSPETWADRNDAYYLEHYRDSKKLLSVLAICLSLHRETFHHWSIFSGGSSGVCIEFDKNKFDKQIPTDKNFMCMEVTYNTIEDLQNQKPEVKSWPFLKRKPFEDEREYRIIFESETEKIRFKQVSIDLSCINKITLSPWLPEPVSQSVMNIIKSIEGCSDLEVNLSSLLENDRWKKLIG
jgi:hypothetical protein